MGTLMWTETFFSVFVGLNGVQMWHLDAFSFKLTNCVNAEITPTFREHQFIQKTEDAAYFICDYCLKALKRKSNNNTIPVNSSSPTGFQSHAPINSHERFFTFK